MIGRRFALALTILLAAACSGEDPIDSGASGGNAGTSTGGLVGSGGGAASGGQGSGGDGSNVASGGGPQGTGGEANPSGGAGSGGQGNGTGGVSEPGESEWLPSWATSIQGYEASKADHQPPIALPNNTIRQFVYPSFDGEQVRIQISNEKGATPLDLLKVHLAQPSNSGGIDAASDVAFTFGGNANVTVPAGATVWSDGAAFSLKRATQVAISIQFGAQVPTEFTTHPGSRTTSYFASGDAVATASIGNQTRDRWYFINALEVMAPADAAAIAVLGDSITDGYGIINEFKRWPDILTVAIGADATLKNKVSVLNFGMGANELTRSSEDQDAGKERFKRDVLTREKVKWLIVLEGVNDINNGVAAQPILDAYEEIITAAQAKGILVYISPITPLGSNNAVRNSVNDWIRTSGEFDAVIDFDAVIRNTSDQHVIATMYNNDGLHPNAAGYAAMGNAVDLDLFR